MTTNDNNNNNIQALQYHGKTNERHVGPPGGQWVKTTHINWLIHPSCDTPRDTNQLVNRFSGFFFTFNSKISTATLRAEMSNKKRQY